MSLDIYLLKRNVVAESAESIAPDEVLYEANITHNLGKMATELGIYQVLWRMEETDVLQAKDLYPYIRKAIIEMVTYPEYYKKFDSDNGWGTFKDFLPWLSRLIVALDQYPESYLATSR
jgi:hypothetical protein